MVTFWIKSEFGQKNLEETLAENNMERAHRLGRTNLEKPRPFIVNFSSLKVKQRILSQGFQLLNSVFLVGENVSDKTRLERKQLLEQAKSQERPYKLRSNKLSI